MRLVVTRTRSGEIRVIPLVLRRPGIRRRLIHSRRERIATRYSRRKSTKS